MRSGKLLQYFFIFCVVVSCDSDTSLSSADGGGTGQGGSMTRFSIQGNRMYIVDHTSVSVFDIANNNFAKINQVEVNMGIETIFAKGEYLYLGANDAMYIYSIANPDQPAFVFRYAHIVSCDPVVVQGDRAYVTMRGGTRCNLGTNALEIIDISDPNAPTLIANYPMTSPHGLAVDGNVLFICEGESGLKMFDISNERDIQLKSHLTDFFAYDVIARSGVATITGEDGIFQYAYNPEKLNLLSKIMVSREAL
ncbi:MAG TPA: hypothetical protein VGD40_22840 [Chryseosolibacter sp.]